MLTKKVIGDILIKKYITKDCDGEKSIETVITESLEKLRAGHYKPLCIFTPELLFQTRNQVRTAGCLPYKDYGLVCIHMWTDRKNEMIKA